MRDYRIYISERATKDMRDIVNYITRELFDAEAAKKLVDKFEKAIKSLSQMPKRNPLLLDEDLSMIGIRRIIVENYVIFYICDDINQSVSIIRVLYNKRNWKDLI